MQNDVSRQWSLLTPFVPGEMLAAQAKQIESMGLAGIFEGFHGMANYGKPVEHLRETVDIIRHVIANAHIPGALTTYEGKYNRHDWSTFLGSFAPPLRTEIPIWIAANQKGLTRLAGEIAQGFIDHPIHGPRWALNQGSNALKEDWPRRAGTGRTFTGTPGSGWRSTTTGPKRSTTPGPPSPSKPA